MNRRILTLWSLVFLFSTLLSAQTAKPGWTKYIINGGEVSLSLPNSLKLYQSKDKGFKATKNADGSYSVRSEDSIIFVPVGDQTDYDKENEMYITNMVMVQIDEGDDGLSKAIKYMKKSSLVRNMAGWALKKAVGMKQSKDQSLEVTDSEKVLLNKVGNKDAVSLGLSVKDDQKREGDAKIYLIDGNDKGVVLLFMNRKGQTGFTKQDRTEILSSIRVQ